MNSPPFVILYQSSASRAFSSVDLDRILTVAVAWNGAHGVTGLLLYGDAPHLPGIPGHFVQWLEGPEADVRGLYTRIERDRRHTNVEALACGAVRDVAGGDDRLFPDWAMATKRLGDLPATLHSFLETTRSFPADALSRSA